MNVLLVEPDFPVAAKSKNHSHFLPVGLLKIGSYHKAKGDKVKLGMDVRDKSALKVGMNIGVKMGSAIDIGEIISIEDGFVRVRHPSKSVSCHPIGFFEFVELV